MYMSRLVVRKESAFLLAHRNPYLLHQMIWSLFGDNPGRKRDFLYRVVDQVPRVYFLAVSERPPHDTESLWHIETRRYDPFIEKGQRYEFSLRANPVRTGRNRNGRHARFDVVMDAYLRCTKRHRSASSHAAEQKLIREAGLRWLTRRSPKLGISFRPEEVVVGGYRKHPFTKGSHEVTVATLDFRGILSVEDPQCLTHALYHGIGPAKAFGCGLLLLRLL